MPFGSEASAAKGVRAGSAVSVDRGALLACAMRAAVAPKALPSSRRVKLDIALAPVRGPVDKLADPAAVRQTAIPAVAGRACPTDETVAGTP